MRQVCPSKLYDLLMDTSDMLFTEIKTFLMHLDVLEILIEKGGHLTFLEFGFWFGGCVESGMMWEDASFILFYKIAV